MPTLIEEKSPRPEKSAGETIVRTKYREFRHWRNVKVVPLLLIARHTHSHSLHPLTLHMSHRS